MKYLILTLVLTVVAFSNLTSADYRLTTIGWIPIDITNGSSLLPRDPQSSSQCPVRYFKCSPYGYCCEIGITCAFGGCCPVGTYECKDSEGGCCYYGMTCKPNFKCSNSVGANPSQTPKASVGNRLT